MTPAQSTAYTFRAGIRKKVLLLAVVGVACGGGLWFRYGTLQGVPAAIVFQFLTDTKARNAYFSGQPRVLHDRLREMGIEDKIKAFYRDQYPDEVQLDWFIHQLLYDRTGYVGGAYKVGAQAQLTLKTPKDREFSRWFVLARRADVVRGRREDNGVQWVMLRNGTYVTYYTLSEIYPIQTLRRLIRQQGRKPSGSVR